MLTTKYLRSRYPACPNNNSPTNCTGAEDNQFLQLNAAKSILRAMTLDEVRVRLGQGTEHLWWSWRFLELVLAKEGSGLAEETLTQAVDCFVRLAAEDPSWASGLASDMGPMGYSVTKLLSADRLVSALSRLRLPVLREEALLRARLLSSAADWQREHAGELWRQAWRDDEWKEIAIRPAAFVDYTAYLDLATWKLASLQQDFYRAMFLPTAIAAAHHGTATGRPSRSGWLLSVRCHHHSSTATRS